MNNYPFVSVIVPVFNEEKFISKCLNAILHQDYPAEQMEILVVDGRSTDNSRDIVEQYAQRHGNLRLLDNPKQIQAAALNIGILAAQGDIIIRVDGHTLIDTDYVTNCVQSLTENQAKNVGGLMRPMGTSYAGQGIALATSSPFGIGGSKFHYSEREQYVDTVYLGAYWRELFDKIGLYDEALLINEDYELNYRLRKAGGKILLNPSIKSTYIPRSSLPALWCQYFKYGRWKIRTLQKHPASLHWRQTIAPLFVASLVSSLLLGFFWSPFYWLCSFIFISYLLANLVASTMAAYRGGWQYLPVLPIIFGILHIAWGLGFWYGLVRIPFEKNFK